jgi:hypothetical protein
MRYASLDCFTEGKVRYFAGIESFYNSVPSFLWCSMVASVPRGGIATIRLRQSKFCGRIVWSAFLVSRSKVTSQKVGMEFLSFYSRLPC